MCRELIAMGTREPMYNVVAFIMKATVFATPVAEEKDAETTDLKQGTGLETTPITTLTTLTTTLRLTESQQGILKVIKDNPVTSASGIVAKIGGITLDGVKYNLKALCICAISFPKKCNTATVTLGWVAFSMK